MRDGESEKINREGKKKSRERRVGTEEGREHLRILTSEELCRLANPLIED